MTLIVEKSPAKIGAGNPHGYAGAENPRLADHEVTWNGPDDPENPYNWPSYRKVTVAVVCSASQLVTTMSASMIAPALDQILRDLGMSTSTGQIAFSVFFLGLGFAPFLVAALAETYGRKPLWLAGNIWYIIWNSLCPVGFSPAVMILGRLMSASGASVGVTLTGPVMADMYQAKDRGKSLAIAGLLPYIGPALGPIVGGLASQHLWWPWLFWILSIFDAACLVLGFFVIHESYAPVLLHRKAKRIAACNTPENSPRTSFMTQARIFLNDMLVRLRPAISRPVKLFIHRPIIQLIAISMAIEFGIYTLVLSTFASLWITRYDQSESTASLHYIAIALGAFACAQGGGRLMDFMWRRTTAAHPDNDPTPEYRIPYIVTGFIPAVAGLFWYAWSAQNGDHWAVVDVGIFCFTCGGFMFAQGMTAYLVDEFTSTRAASASAATRLWTYILGFIFPIFAPNLYETLGYGWGNSLLALLFVLLGAPIVLIIWQWGGRIRAVGRTAEDEKERLS
ncbi:major facilitator superfamily domain-containing protein [Dactylonectria estremocensis]|uniref:Major facilitator superfamily domain-containing protein n=1 Tax=Dactylonectria estremocensis TaxID=1079267 RepID=A0A9P9FMG2_9HYPO|nr:major facilitator superfamily domain-containing protein [Dactylonectria estremocensis]